jgi:excisionase family DNA binding protein
MSLNMSSKITEKKFSLEEAAAIIGINTSGVRLLLNNRKLGYYQSGKRRIIGESHLTEYLTKIERNKTKEKIY